MFNKIMVFVLTLLAFTAQAQIKPIKVIMPFGPGGQTDIIAKALDQTLTKQLSHPIVIEYRPGAGGLIALRLLAQNRSDDILLTLIDAFSLASILSNNNDIKIDDFNYVGIIGSTSLALAVRKDSELMNLAIWSKQDRVAIGVNGQGGAQHYHSYLIRHALKAPVIDVFYKSAGELITALMGRHIDAIWTTANVLIPYEQTGKIDIIATVSDQRLLNYIPTFTDLGLRNFGIASDWILISNLSSDNYTKTVQKALFASLTRDDLRQTLLQAGLIIKPEMFSQSKKILNQRIQQQEEFSNYLKANK